MKKHILLLALILLSLTGFAQTLESLPTGSKNYGNQLYLAPNGDIIAGTGSGKFRVVDRRQRVDSLLIQKVAKSDTIQDFLVDTADVNNTRNDATSVIKLNNGDLLIAYSRFGSNSPDVATDAIWCALSSNNGVTWKAPKLLVPKISNGSAIPSFYRKKNGNILLMFFVRDSAVVPFSSRIFKAEFDDNLNQISAPSEVPLPMVGYYPIGADRIFYDLANDKLLFPYPKLISGTGVSGASIYEGRLLVSSDDGSAWSDAGISIGSGVLSATGFGGATEPGIFTSPFTGTVYYFRTLTGFVYASKIVGASYTPSAEYKLFESANAMAAVKYWPSKKMVIAVVPRINDYLPLSTVNRRYIDLITSVDGTEWNRNLNIDFTRGTDVLNEPSIYIDDKKEFALFTYSITNGSATWYNLKSKKIIASQIQNTLAPTFKNGFGVNNGKVYNGYQTNPRASVDGYTVRVNNPTGGSFVYTTSNTTGAIRITLPDNSLTLYTIKGTVFGANNKSFSFEVSCYANSMAAPYNTALIKTSDNTANFVFRFVSDGTRPKIYIGELSTVWSVLGVTIDEVSGFRQAKLETIAEGWEIGIEPTAFAGTTVETRLAGTTFPYSNLNQPLTGYVIGANSALLNTDTKLVAFGKIQGQLSAKVDQSTILSGSATLDFPSTVAGAVADLTISVTGAAVGDVVSIGVPNGSITATSDFTSWVSSTNTVTIRYSPKATEDPASGTFKVKIFK